MLVSGAGAAWSRHFLPGAGPVFLHGAGRLRGLERPEPEPPKKVAAPQHCFSENTNVLRHNFCCRKAILI